MRLGPPANSVLPIADFLNGGVVAAGSYDGVPCDNSVHILTVCARSDSHRGPGRRLYCPLGFFDATKNKT